MVKKIKEYINYIVGSDRILVHIDILSHQYTTYGPIVVNFNSQERERLVPIIIHYPLQNSTQGVLFYVKIQDVIKCLKG